MSSQRQPHLYELSSRSLFLWLLLMILPCGCQTLEYDIAEELDPGAFIGNIATDANLAARLGSDVADTLEFRFLTTQEVLTIDKISGIVRTAQRIDRETVCPPRTEHCKLAVTVAITPAEYFESISVVVNIKDVNDNAPLFPSREVTKKVSELTQPGLKIKLPVAQDPDWGINSVQEYKLEPSTELFQLEVSDHPNGLRSVNLLLMGELDREKVDFYQMTLLAYDGGDPRLSGSTTVNVMVEDGNDHSPYFVNDTYSATLPENSPINSSILRVTARDDDVGDYGRVTYSINQDPQATAMFGIDPSTGSIYLRKNPDYERKSSYTFVVEANDGGPNSQPAQATVVVNIIDLNDNAPQIEVNALTSSGGAQISEFSLSGTFVAHVSVTDLDALNNGQFSCVLDSTKFQLEQLQESQYKIVTAAEFDRETQTQHFIKITCEDEGEPSQVSTETVTVSVLDENDNSPIFTQNVYSVTIVENNHVDAFIVRVNATDSDIGKNADITYKLQDNTSPVQLLKINSKTGVVSANIVFDYETLKQFQFNVVATDGGKPSKSTMATVYVSVLDTNDNAPFFSKPSYTFEVLENQPIGMEIGLVAASDADSPPYDEFEFSLLPGRPSQLFAVDTITGHVRTKGSLDREYEKSYTLTVLATNINVDQTLSSTVQVNIVVQDQNDNAPHVDFPNQQNHTIHISNRVPVGYEVGKIRAHDVDLDENSKLTFAFTHNSDNRAFYINELTGLISTRDSLHVYDTKLFEMQVLVSDAGVPPKTATATLYVVVDKSIPYAGSSSSNSLLGSTNLTIVIALTVSSAIIVIILVVAIILTKMNSRKNNNNRNPASKYRIANFNIVKPTAVKNQSQPSKNGVKDNSKNTDKETQLQQPNAKKEVSFNINNETLNACPRNTTVEKSNKVNNNGNGKSSSNGQQWSSPTAVSADPSKIPTYSSEGVSMVGGHLGGGSGSSYVPTNPGAVYSINLPQTTPSIHPDLATQKVWEMNMKQLQCQQWFESMKPDQDTDNSSAGEISNTDSGRGPSEEGENSLGSLAPVLGAHGAGLSNRHGPGAAIRGSSQPAKSSQAPPKPPAKKPNFQLATQRQSAGRPEVPAKRNTSNHRDPYSGQRMPPHHKDNLHHRDSPRAHQPSHTNFRSNSNQKHSQNRLSGTYGNPRLPEDCYHHQAEPWYGVPNSEAYGDNASTTSGSYVVDSKDLDDVVNINSPTYKSVVV